MTDPEPRHRTVDSCEYREDVRFPGASREVARCRLLREISGVEDESLLDASRGACDVCVRKFPPSATDINSVVASLLYGVAEAVIKRDGTPGCSTTEAERLRLRAKQSLEVIMQPGAAPVETSPRGPCLYLGRQVGERLCEDCRGSVRLKVFDCLHELYRQTTVGECRRCQDHEERLASGPGAVTAWSAAVTTAPRDQPTLAESLASLADAGWPEAHVFAEPDSSLPADLDESRLTQRRQKLGAWPNWLLSLNEMVLRDPDADAYLLCQDDVLYCRGLREYLEQTLWPTERVGVVSLHTASHQDRGDTDGFYATGFGWGAWGAQAYVFPNASARALLRNHEVVNHRQRGPRDGLCNVDSVVGRWSLNSKLDYYLHSPSLTQHIGEASTLWEKADTSGRRRAATFVGAESDIRSVMGLPTS
ncbi:MAG: hypothetical protein ACR2RV_01740 [Verrucomicrobiales bacterium]